MGRIGGKQVVRTLGAVLAAVLLLASAPAQVASDPPVFRVDVKLVRLLVTVKNAAGELIGSLTRDDFTILDNGVPQEIALFERQTEQPLSIAVLVDTSASTAKDLKYEIESVRKFLRAIVNEGNPRDTVALYSFNWEVTLQSSFTRRLARLENALRRLKSEGGTSMYDAIYFAAKDLEHRDGRRVIVIVTDGGDTTSAKRYHQALEEVQLADCVIYPILVVPIPTEAGRNVGGENALTTLAQSTGGRVFTPSLGESLDAAFAEILRDLRTQYLIGFYPKNVPLTKERFHRLDVKVSQPGYRVQARTGYFGDYEKPAPPTRGPALGQP